MNRRDNTGRTALHIAIMFNNKSTAETLLNLGANPHVPDIFGQRPIDICNAEGLVNLLRVKMQSTQPPFIDSLDKSKSLKSTTSSKRI